MNVAVIGAGPAGLSSALALAKNNIDVTLFEADSIPGGMCKTLELWNMKVDLGPHRFFSMDKKISEFWLSPLKNDFVLIDRLTRIFYNNRFFMYPIKPLDALSKLGFFEALHCGTSYIAAQFAPKGNETTFAEWVSRRFGYRLYEIFFKSYSEKLWGISCAELDASFAAQRIKGLNFLETLKNAVFKGKTKHKTLVDQFAYPTLGAGMPYARMAEELIWLGAKLQYNTRVISVNPCSKEKSMEIILPDGAQEFDHVICTMPLTDLVQSCTAFDDTVQEASKKLRYRNTIIVYLLVNSENIFQDNWIYIHAPFLKTGRITNFRNWSPAMCVESNKTILAMEYWANDEDALWKSADTELEDLAAREMTMTGLVPPDLIEDARVVRLHRSYPVYAAGYEQELAKIQTAIDKIPALTCIGRNGAFKYNNQDHSILMGLLAAENILEQASNNLWQINTDYDYQEKGKSSLSICS